MTISVDTLAADLEETSLKRASARESFAGLPIVFVLRENGYRVLGYDAYLIAGLIQTTPEFCVGAGGETVPVVEIPSMFINQVVIQLMEPNVTAVFDEKEIPAGLHGLMLGGPEPEPNA